MVNIDIGSDTGSDGRRPTILVFYSNDRPWIFGLDLPGDTYYAVPMKIEHKY